jgi:hypothetical protein
LSFTAKLPVSALKTVGINVTLIWQVAPATRVCGAIGHFELSAKSPDVVMLLIARGTVCELVTMTILGVLGVLMAMFPKERVVALRV